ncbi:MAG TPA: SOS response-associated peptidase [Casimicrobiaceae bacterium]|jgi:putative SOS response-associated peptidase YedK
MCGRYELSSHPTAIALAFGLAHAPDLEPRYNIAPTQRVPIVRLDASGARELVEVKWGLVPRWARDPSIGGRLFNARAETVAQKAAFRAAYARHRCLVPANAFYEWQVRPGGKQPLHIGMPDDAPFGIAGLFERWRSSTDEVLDTCTIITTDANEALRPIHDRMPVILPPASYARWLDATNADVADLLVPWSGPELNVYAVSTRVNRAENDDAGVREPIQASLL